MRMCMHASLQTCILGADVPPGKIGGAFLACTAGGEALWRFFGARVMAFRQLVSCAIVSASCLSFLMEMHYACLEPEALRFQNSASVHPASAVESCADDYAARPPSQTLQLARALARHFGATVCSRIESGTHYT